MLRKLTTFPLWMAQLRLWRKYLPAFGYAKFTDLKMTNVEEKLASYYYKSLKVWQNSVNLYFLKEPYPSV